MLENEKVKEKLEETVAEIMAHVFYTVNLILYKTFSGLLMYFNLEVLSLFMKI